MKSDKQTHFVLDRQAKREALWAILLALGYFFWWFFSAYIVAAPVDEQQLPPLFWGMPLWFLLSCVVGPVVFTLLCALMVKYLYNDIDLDSYDEDQYE
ncbi:YhdT family protein [Vibrio sp. Y2-5]|uniref:YhdT family protein n=1 Tax=Vibrio sp. Y2-5 TaxID=2743977 RepID=UPI001660345C|nr:YhdT family protein [Vibrio sp. Y2-5]MBD0787320.1 YhdT family protein [Vibrio sp. Y2-5]